MFLYIFFDKNKTCESCQLNNTYYLSSIVVLIYGVILVSFYTQTFIFFLTIVDDQSIYTYITRIDMLNFISVMQNQFNTKVKVVRSHNCKEFALMKCESCSKIAILKLFNKMSLLKGTSTYSRYYSQHFFPIKLTYQFLVLCFVSSCSPYKKNSYHVINKRNSL